MRTLLLDITYSSDDCAMTPDRVALQYNESLIERLRKLEKICIEEDVTVSFRYDGPSEYYEHDNIDLYDDVEGEDDDLEDETPAYAKCRFEEDFSEVVISEHGVTFRAHEKLSGVIIESEPVDLDVFAEAEEGIPYQGQIIM